MLRRRSIRLRIIVLVLVPVLALIGLYGVVLDLTLGNFLSLRQASYVRNEVTTPVSNVQIQLSAERTLALAYLADPTHSRVSQLLDQEHKSDAAIASYLNASSKALMSGAGSKEQEAIASWRASLATRGLVRATVLNRRLSSAAAAGAYTAIVSGGNQVLSQALIPLLDTSAGIQANGLVAMDESLQAAGEESDLIKADLIAHTFPVADRQLIAQLAVARQELWNQAFPGLDRTYQNYLQTMIPPSASKNLATMESEVLSGGRAARNVSLQAWTSAQQAYSLGFRNALRASANSLRNSALSEAHGILVQLLLTGGLGLIAILIAVVIGFLVSRDLIRQLNDLRHAAVELSAERLPSAIERLRAGDEVDIGSETPLLSSSTNEIGQVRQAFNVAARTAIAAALDEVKIRRGVNDVFRNLARRNQSLLSRQLQLLDAMERRVHDPEELADLFRVDHLTTRMRRHAEGLLIVAGGSSGRTWREPVPIVDVMRAAVAEVEDYTRIRVASRSGAAVAGHAVNDIIHLLAELVENATSFSPANTPVRIDGDKVARGLVVEIEDRGLGMEEDQIAEINTTLANPPLFDLSGSDRLGLFIAGQLGRRHDVKITLRGSAYGGITAVVLIPRALIIDAEYDEPTPMAGIRQLGGRPVPQLPAAMSGAANGSDSGLRTTASTKYLSLEKESLTAAAPVTGLPGSPVPVAADPLTWSVPAADSATRSVPAAADPGTRSAPAVSDRRPVPLAADSSSWSASAGSDARPVPLAADSSSWSVSAADSATWSMPAHADSTGWSMPAGAESRSWSVPGDSDTRPMPADAQSSSWSAPSDSATRSMPARGDSGTWSVAPAESGTWSMPAADPGTWSVPQEPGSASHAINLEDNAAPLQRRSGTAWSEGSAGTAERESANGHPAAPQAELDGLPVRVRQANLAPQLRDQSATVQPERNALAPEPSPEAARNLMAALQRGWERGRSAAGPEPAAEPESGEPTFASAPDTATPDTTALNTTAPGPREPGPREPGPREPGPREPGPTEPEWGQP